MSDSKTLSKEKPIKYTYIVYPKTMKVPAFVDVLEANEGTLQSDSIQDYKHESFDNTTNDVTQSPGAKSAQSLSREKTKLKKDFNRPKSRNQQINKLGSVCTASVVKM